ncbi:MAG: GNAT family N-acetyltransferase [Candidatus Goldiibacteriota bacterium]|jgi:predicted GNAT family acetyltransferase
MDIQETRDKVKLKDFLMKDPYLHIYELGDLQEKLFPAARWFVLEDNGEILSSAMMYTAKNINIFYLVEDTRPEAAAELLKAIMEKLPDEMYCLVSANLVDVIKERYGFEKTVSYDKMKLTGDIFLSRNIKYPEFTYRINVNDSETVGEFLREINPGAFYNKGMLATGKYFCIRKNASLLAMAGVHLYSKEFSVAAIGNVVTAENERGKGYSTSVMASLCADLWKDVKIIGLNVRGDNTPAIKVYTKLGFIKHTSHVELTAVRK